MLIFLLGCFLAGALLAQRFKILVLIPATALAIVVDAGMDRGNTIWQIVIAATLTTCCMQVGYFVGANGHDIFVASRTNPRYADGQPHSLLQRSTRAR
jgi:hypothetical protein